MSRKRFFTVDDGGNPYAIVATDVEHAKQVLREHGVEFTKEDGYSAPIDDPAFAALEWRELTAERAARKFTLDEEREPYRAPLSERPLGAFYCAEW